MCIDLVHNCDTAGGIYIAKWFAVPLSQVRTHDVEPMPKNVSALPQRNPPFVEKSTQHRIMTLEEKALQQFDQLHKSGDLLWHENDPIYVECEGFTFNVS